MVEFFQNIWNGLVLNKDEIVLFFTSSNFVAFITTIVMLVKQLKANKSSNETNKGLKTSLDGAVSIAADVVSIRDNTSSTNDKLVTVQNDLESFKKEIYYTLDTIVQKMDAVLEVQSIVYSTIKDETIRKNVNGILMDAKHTETATRASLKEEVESLRKKLKEKTDVIKDVVEDAVVEDTAVKDASVKVKKVTATNKRSVPRY
jgi:predicted  nucleic acid-binding Zn-ribbon protein